MKKTIIGKFYPVDGKLKFDFTADGFTGVEKTRLVAEIEKHALGGNRTGFTFKDDTGETHTINFNNFRYE